MENQMIELFRKASSAPWEKSDFALVLGTEKEGCLIRARIAAEYFHQGGTERLILCGGVKRDGQAECEILYEELLRLGVPKEAMYLENESRDTMENFLFSLRIASLQGFLLSSKKVAIITEPYHAFRSLMMGKHLLPFFLTPLAISKGFEEEVTTHFERYQSEIAILQTIAKLFSMPIEEILK